MVNLFSRKPKKKCFDIMIFCYVAHNQLSILHIHIVSRETFDSKKPKKSENVKKDSWLWH